MELHRFFLLILCLQVKLVARNVLWLVHTMRCC